MRTHRIGLLSTRVHYFETVVRTGSVRRAALKLNVAPSAISRSIAQLEQDLGTALFERIRQRLKLTSAGEILIHHARITSVELNKAYDLIDDLKGLRRGTVNIAVVESVARGLLPEILARFWKQFPEIVVEIRIMGSRQAFEAVLMGESDLALAFDDRESKNGLAQLTSISLDMGALVPPDHPLAKRDEVRMRDLVNERVLMSDSSLTLAASIEEAMQYAFGTINPRSRTNSISVMTELTLHGCGIAFQTRVGVEKELAERKLMFLPLRDSRLRPRKLVLMARSQARLSHAAAAFKDMIASGLDRLR
jgi:DNA-binding transcriptional LysR family regulator